MTTGNFTFKFVYPMQRAYIHTLDLFKGQTGLAVRSFVVPDTAGHIWSNNGLTAGILCGLTDHHIKVNAGADYTSVVQNFKQGVPLCTECVKVYRNLPDNDAMRLKAWEARVPYEYVYLFQKPGVTP